VTYWLNFHEDGPWVWYWHVLRSGCWRGHAWVEEPEYDNSTDASYFMGTHTSCSRCGQYKGFEE
jgi:hypothetical protein